ncbi:MAG TPA: hypothetical protein VGL49_01390 [Acidimicrobiales bacterium]
MHDEGGPVAGVQATQRLADEGSIDFFDHGIRRIIEAPDGLERSIGGWFGADPPAQDIGAEVPGHDLEPRVKFAVLADLWHRSPGPGEGFLGDVVRFVPIAKAIYAVAADALAVPAVHRGERLRISGAGFPARLGGRSGSSL